MKVSISGYPRNGEQRVKVKIHPYDIWNLDVALAHIIHPALLMLKQDKMGCPHVDDVDVPDELKYSPIGWDHDIIKMQPKWDYVLDKMIEYFALVIDGKDTVGHPGIQLFAKHFSSLWT